MDSNGMQYNEFKTDVFKGYYFHVSEDKLSFQEAVQFCSSSAFGTRATYVAQSVHMSDMDEKLYNLNFALDGSDQNGYWIGYKVVNGSIYPTKHRSTDPDLEQEFEFKVEGDLEDGCVAGIVTKGSWWDQLIDSFTGDSPKPQFVVKDCDDELQVLCFKRCNARAYGRWLPGPWSKCIKNGIEYKRQRLYECKSVDSMEVLDNDHCSKPKPDPIVDICSLPYMKCFGNWTGCCTNDHPCNLGDGDCDSHDQCLGNLACGQNNCNLDLGFEFTDDSDCCTSPKWSPWKQKTDCSENDNSRWIRECIPEGATCSPDLNETWYRCDDENYGWSFWMDIPKEDQVCKQEGSKWYKIIKTRFCVLSQVDPDSMLPDACLKDDEWKVECQPEFGDWSSWSSWSECLDSAAAPSQSRSRSRPITNFQMYETETEKRTCNEGEIGLRCLGSKNCCRDQDGQRCEEHDGHCNKNEHCSEGLVCGKKTCYKKDILSFWNNDIRCCKRPDQWTEWTIKHDCALNHAEAPNNEFYYKVMERSCQIEFCEKDSKSFIKCEPQDGQWSGWNPMSDSCTDKCVIQYQRSCNNPSPMYGGQDCEGSETKYKACRGGNCPLDCLYEENWVYKAKDIALFQMFRLDFSIVTCQQKCQENPDCGGFRANLNAESLNGNCRLRAIGGQKVLKDDNENTAVSGPVYCQDPIHGQWSSWTVSDGDCTFNQNRQKWTKPKTRTCDNPKPQYRGDPCSENPEDSLGIYTCPPENGQWSEFISNGQCDERCILTFTRQCIGQKYGGQPCDGDTTKFETCTNGKCPHKDCYQQQIPYDFGQIISSIEMESLDYSIPKCQAKCQENDQCKSFTARVQEDENKQAGIKCQLKSEVGTKGQVSNKVMSGPKYCPGKII